MREEVLTGLRKLKEGDFNEMSQEWQPDRSVIITLSSAHYPEVYRFRVKHLYEKDEEVFDADEDKFIPTRDLR